MTLRPAISLNSRTWKVCWKPERNKASTKLPPPVLESMVERIALKLVVLPERIVCILDRKRLKSCRFSREYGLIECRRLPNENIERPAIRNNMVHGQQQQVVFLPQPQQTNTQQWSMFQIERRTRLLGG